MEDDGLNLVSLRERFLDQYKEDNFYKFFEIIYDKVENEFLTKFEKFHHDLVRSLKPDKQEIIERELFEYDLMNNICNYLFLLFQYCKSSYELKFAEYNEPIPVVLVHFENYREKKKKESYVRKKSDEYNLPFFIIYLEIKRFRSLIDSLLLQPSILLSIMRSKSSHISSQYRKKLRNKNKYLNQLLPDAIYGKSMKGKKLHPQTRKMYQRILGLQKELTESTKNKRKSSLLNAVKEYSKVKHKYWSDKRIMSIYETIRQLVKKNRL